MRPEWDSHVLKGGHGEARFPGHHGGRGPGCPAADPRGAEAKNRGGSPGQKLNGRLPPVKAWNRKSSAVGTCRAETEGRPPPSDVWPVVTTAGPSV